MDFKICKTCKKESIMGIDIFSIHICTDCLDSIKNLEIGETNYNYYKYVIGEAWKRYNKLNLN